jgi:dipeptidyl aminopeptidase/acylaminoacyl peptidase
VIESIGKFEILGALPQFLGRGPSDVNAYRVRYKSGDLDIAAWFYEPSQNPLSDPVHPIDFPAPPGAAIICGHGGVGGIPDHYDLCLRRLAKAGWTIAVPAYRGEDGSGGKIEFALGEVDDTLACLQAVQSFQYVDSEKIWLLGSSHGAMVCLLTLARMDEHSGFRGGIAISGIYDLVKWVSWLKEVDHHLMGDPFVKYLAGLDEDELEKRACVRHAGDIEVPVMLVHGEADMIVPREQSGLMADAFNVCGKANYKILIESGSDHEFIWGPDREPARNTWNKIMRFLAENTR